MAWRDCCDAGGGTVIMLLAGKTVPKGRPLPPLMPFAPFPSPPLVRIDVLLDMARLCCAGRRGIWPLAGSAGVA